MGSAPQPIKLNQSGITKNGIIGEFHSLGELLIFLVEADQGHEFWRTNGSRSGTYKLAEAILSPPCVLGETVFFTTKQGLWTSDGSPSGTMLARLDVESEREVFIVHSAIATGDDLLVIGGTPIDGDLAGMSG